MLAFNVFRITEVDENGGTSFYKLLIDIVFYQRGISAAAIKRQMVARGEYPPNIYVSRRRRS